MAEIIVTALIKVVFQKLGDEALKQVVRAKGIQSQLKNLGNTLSMIQDLLNDASDKETANTSVKTWLNRLRHLAYDIDDVLDSLATEAMHREFTSKVRNLIPSLKLNKELRHQLDSIASRLQQLEKDAHFLGLIVKAENPIRMSSRKNETSLPDSSKIVGREREKKELLHKLLGDDQTPCKEKFSVIPIVGMGGVGKTTLARSLYNETQVKDHFKLRVWVCVSDDFDVFKISEAIFRAMSSENREFKELNELQIALLDQIKEKQFLLVLDDIWSEEYHNWENLVKPFDAGALGSKIILTTRKEGLLKQIGFNHLDKLDSLSHDDAMSLLARHALDADNFNSHPMLKPHGDGIVKHCGRLPLALKVVGRLLRERSDERDWRHVLNSEVWHVKNANNIVPALKLSYQELSACSKQLFAYCSFFPKDFLFDKRELVMLWVAEGFIKQSSKSMLTEESLGHEYFDELLSRSFFQHAPNDQSLFVMHDLLNDLATLVAEDFFLRFTDQIKMNKETLAKYRHMSFIREKYVGYQKFEAIKSAKSLRTFLSVGVKRSSDCFYLSNKILVQLLPELPLLRVLSLSGFAISEVPQCIVRLKHLRYLNLSQTKINELPENVGTLYNLQSLIVYGCDKLCKLPKSFSKLKNLSHFDIRDTPLLMQMPLGIGELNNLKTLTKIIVVEDDGFTITRLKELNNLEGKISIEGLDKMQSSTHARDTKLSEKRLTEVKLAWSDVPHDSQTETLENEVLYELKPCNDSLTILKIVSYHGTKFPSWVGDPSFHKLVHMSIVGCRKCTSLPAFGRLQSLKELVIEGMKEVKVMGSELLGTGCVAFPSLETLRFKNLPHWRVWSTCKEVVDGVFPCLRELYIHDCPELIDISLEEIDSLRYLDIKGGNGGLLRSIVHVASSVTELMINNIAGLNDEAWRSVIKNLGKVEQVWVNRCNEIRYMWESEEEASKVLVNLRYLEVNGCLELVRLGEKEEDYKSNLLKSLRILRLTNCENMKDCGCPGNIEKLSIIKCSSLTHVSFPIEEEGGGGMQNLKSLTIEDCKELVVMGKTHLFGMGKNTNTQMLECVFINNWPNVKSMNGLLNSIHLTTLGIWSCKNMESFPDLELPNLTSLRNLTIAFCPSMDGCFPRGHWPPKLTILGIGGLKKPMSKWGPQNFPTSLVDLSLYGVMDEGVRNLTELSPHLFPSNLTSFGIWNFMELESASTGLQHLTSLKHLEIGYCINLKDLPEKQLPSLLSLRIHKCPKLIESKSKSERGSFNYWPKISHIPCIEIDGELHN
uniref:putative disease resistance RPP13-like protein 1 n=1 Tax=Erigeron canadensis TaxID=72917 RepID=UPI001CB98EBE|nr:putative disease resistance RPP13-like protein 1 [Erigeron canadensis]